MIAYPDALELDEISAYHRDAEKSLRLYFAKTSSDYELKFFGMTDKEVGELLSKRILETEIRSSLALLTSLEALFRVDFTLRCRTRSKDDLSRHFRSVERATGPRVRLEEDILEGWKVHFPEKAGLIGEIRSSFNYRNWIAHGRYWTPKLGRKYDYFYLELLAVQIMSNFSLRKD